MVAVLLLQVEELQRDLEAAKQRAAELEAKAAGLEKERDTLQAERKEGKAERNCSD